MSNKPRAGQVSTNTDNFDYILSVADDDAQKAFNTIDNHVHAPERGGTGQTTYNEGDILYADGYNSLTVLPIGASGAMLKSDGYVPYWSDTMDNLDFIIVGKIDVLTPNSTLYLLPNYSESNDEDFISYIIDGYGTLDNLMIHAGTPPGGLIEDAQSLTVTVRIDGYDSILTETITLNGTDATNITAQVAVSHGSLITIKAVTSTSCAAADVIVSVRYKQQLVGNVADYILIGKVGIVTPGATRYLLPNFGQTTTEVFPAYRIPFNGTLTGLQVYCNTAPGIGDDIVITTRINGFDSILTTTVSDADQTAEDYVNVVAVTTDDLITVKAVTSATCAAADVFVEIRYNI